MIIERMTEALIVIDVQNEYTAEGNLPIAYPDFGVAVGNIAAMMDAAAERGVKVVVVQHDAPATAPVFVPGTRNWELHPEIGGRSRDHLLHKAFPSSFAGTDLLDYLRANDVDTVTLVGFMTQNCVLHTAFDAVVHGLAARVVSDATGAPGLANEQGKASAREIHETLMTVFHSNVAAVGTTAEWLAGEGFAKSNLIVSTKAAR
ncbi:isochorismatase [Actinorhabdospora filicis]|uniref:Isochorismatase n=2 Tax=Actinorhabdospora filicis TaxID=1785913 RepID=A0A9W6SFS1_9ACTN|nr:isochorismatase [Actinorhabdospora filicis]